MADGVKSGFLPLTARLEAGVAVASTVLIQAGHSKPLKRQRSGRKLAGIAKVIYSIFWCSCCNPNGLVCIVQRSVFSVPPVLSDPECLVARKHVRDNLKSAMPACCHSSY